MRVIVRLAYPNTTIATQGIEVAKEDTIRELKMKIHLKFKLPSHSFYLKIQKDGYSVNAKNNKNWGWGEGREEEKR